MYPMYLMYLPSPYLLRQLCSRVTSKVDTVPDISNIFSTLKAAGFQIVDNSANSTGSGNSDAVTMAIPAASTGSNIQCPGETSDAGSIANFVNSLQRAGIQVVENQCDQSLSISLPNQRNDDMNVPKGGNVCMTTNHQDMTPGPMSSGSFAANGVNSSW